MRYTCHGHTITPLWDTKRRVAGGEAIDVIVHDEFHKGSRRQATVNARNIEEHRA
jgi:hypothetical protein